MNKITSKEWMRLKFRLRPIKRQVYGIDIKSDLSIDEIFFDEGFRNKIYKKRELNFCGFQFVSSGNLGSKKYADKLAEVKV